MGYWGKHKNYTEYLKSPEWKQLSEFVKKQAGWKCQICDSPIDLIVHHRNYEKGSSENGENCMAVCKRCHANIHGKTSGWHEVLIKKADEAAALIKNVDMDNLTANLMAKMEQNWIQTNTALEYLSQQAGLNAINMINALSDIEALDFVSTGALTNRRLFSRNTNAVIRAILMWGNASFPTQINDKEIYFCAVLENIISETITKTDLEDANHELGECMFFTNDGGQTCKIGDAERVYVLASILLIM